MLILTGLGASTLSLIQWVNTEPHPQSSDDSSLVVACAYFVGRKALLVTLALTGFQFLLLYFWPKEVGEWIIMYLRTLVGSLMTKTWTHLNNIGTPNAISILELLPLIVCHLVREQEMHKEKGPQLHCTTGLRIQGWDQIRIRYFLFVCVSACHPAHATTMDPIHKLWKREWKHNKKERGTQEWCTTLHPTDWEFRHLL